MKRGLSILELVREIVIKAESQKKENSPKQMMIVSKRSADELPLVVVNIKKFV